MKNTTDIFISKSTKIHNNKYDYSLVDYKNNKTKVKIICPTHGIFEQNFKSHVTKKYGCPKCGGTSKKSTLEFISESKKLHNNKYDYSLVEYINNSTKVKIICPTHGIFEQQPNKHLSKQGCVKCSGLKKKTTKQFIQDSKNIHGDKYDYSLVEYKNINTKVKIICPTHGVFEQQPYSHLKGHNCSYCKKVVFENEQHLYILKDTKYHIYKIGKSVDVKRRCRELNSRYYNKNNIIKIIKIFKNKGIFEHNTHKKFIKYKLNHPTKKINCRSDGRTEWFKINLSECVNYIEKL